MGNDGKMKKKIRKKKKKKKKRTQKMEIDISRWMLRAVDKSRKNERKKKKIIRKKTRLSGSLLWLYRRHIGEFLASIHYIDLG